ncbi:MAG: hypothetical protein J6I84_02805 [Bacilli bacterium]|nr:hypothetical protein [Bacilli bacterium]
MDRIKEYAKEIYTKTKYYGNKLTCNKSFIRDNIIKAQETGIFPWTFNRIKTKVQELEINVFSAIIRVVDYGSYYETYNYLKGLDDSTWMIQKTAYGKEDIEFYAVIKFSDHYKERFEERSSGFVRLIGNIDEALSLDLQAAHNSFSNPQGIRDPERAIEILKELTDNTEEHIEKVINIKENISIIKTYTGYGIYRILDITQPVVEIVMITWISRDMMTQKQKDMVDMLCFE